MIVIKYAVALAAFALLNLVVISVANSFAADASATAPVVWWINVIAYSTYVIAGFIAGVLVRRRQVAGAMAVGAVAAAIAMVVFGAGDGSAFGILSLIVTGAALAAIGGACALPLRVPVAIR